LRGQSPAAEILRTLVAIPTPSSISNLPLIEWVREFLEPLGWQVELFAYRDEAGVEKANLIARPGGALAGDFIDLAFICHTDTVPFEAGWPLATVLTEREGHLHGCGACDVKGSLACFLAAASALGDNGIAPGVALILTADEEIGCRGMERQLAASNLRIGAAIVSEPTSLRPGVAGKGYGLARITVTGREAHSAFPQQGVSAISIAARLIARLEDGFQAEGTDGLFDPPRTTLNIGVIEGGSAKNIIPGRCSFVVEWRAIPGQEQASILTYLKSMAGEAQRAEPRARIVFETLRAELGFAPAVGGELRERLAALLPGEPVGISFGSEASRVAPVAREVIVIGPGDMRTAHSDRECVPTAELALWTETLGSLLGARADGENGPDCGGIAGALSG